MENKKETVIALIANKLGIDAEEIKTTDSFADLGFDSLDRVELIMELETTFTIVISDEDAEKIITVEGAIQYIESHG